MTDERKGKVIGLDRKEITATNAENPENNKPNEDLIEALEELLEKAKEGEYKEAVIISKHEDCGLYHPHIIALEGFSLSMYGMLCKMPDIYEDALTEYYDEE